MLKQTFTVPTEVELQGFVRVFSLNRRKFVNVKYVSWWQSKQETLVIANYLGADSLSFSCV